MIEMVAGPAGTKQPNLLFWNGAKVSIRRAIEYGDSTYEAPEFDTSLYQATRFPKGCNGDGSARRLLATLADVFANSLHLPDRESRLLGCFCLSTWLADRLSMAPSLAIFTPDEALGVDVLRLLHSLCRLPLMLAEITRAGLRALPANMSLTLLVCEGALKTSVQRLLRLSSHPGLYLPGNRGGVIHLQGPKVILWGSDVASSNLGDGVISISVAPSSLVPALGKERLDQIADEVQAQLLMFRLRHSAKRTKKTQVDVSQFTGGTRRLAHALAECFPGDLALARETLLLLRPQDEELRAQRFIDVNYALCEILLAEIHSRKHHQIKVENLAKDVNALLQSRGEIQEYSAEEIGWKLKGMNVPKRTDSSGRQILLNRETSQRMHRQAQSYDLASSEALKHDCPDCAASENARAQ
jgi:hypothetical protein